MLGWGRSMLMGAAARMMIGLAASLALLASAPATAAPETALPPRADQSANAWLVLTDLSASQTADPNDPDNSRRRRDAVPPPLWGGANAMADGTAVVVVVGLWWALIAVALGAGDNHVHANSPG